MIESPVSDSGWPSHLDPTGPGGRSTSTRVVGKFLHVADQRFLVKGIAYGTFAPDADGHQFPRIDRVLEDMRAMQRLGTNTVRTYTVPSQPVLDAAAASGLKVMVGIPWTQHVAFLDDARLRRSIRDDVAAAVRACASHPAALLFAIGNEIPPNVVRWHGRTRIERFLQTIYDAAKDAAPDACLTYVNFPPTEFLELPFLDVCAFNVYLHRERDLLAYLARLQHIAGARPLLITEAGADSLSEGEEGQAALTAMQIRAAFAEGAAGAVAYTWTDDWWRGGIQVRDWAFGLTDAYRRPKLAAESVAREFAVAGFRDQRRRTWPKVSVLVCACNAADTLDECLASLEQLDYPHFEIVVVDDGSRDATGEIARRHPRVTLVQTPNRGLSAARNTAMETASGEIVAYIDADARADRDWLTYLVQPFLHSDVIGAGGPNVVPPDDPWMAQCVARSPGGPTHVLIDDRTAEHVPGCNMAFRRSALLGIGGFDPTYRAAGDDVDICWRLQARGFRIGFAPSALVWHRHRSRVRAYWRQQVGYGEAETWLMERHPECFLDGHALWRGRLYSPLPIMRSMARLRVNAGVWGTAPFPSVYVTHLPPIAFLPHQTAWQLISVLLGASAIAAAVGGERMTGFFLLLAGLAGVATTVIRCLAYGWKSQVDGLPRIGQWPEGLSKSIYRLTIAWLHFVQPTARAWGRLRGRLWPPDAAPDVSAGRLVPTLRRAGLIATMATARLATHVYKPRTFWSELWVDRAQFLSRLAERLRTGGVGRSVAVDDGWQQDRDIAVAVGRWGWLTVQTLIEEHASGKCLLRVGQRLRLTPIGAATVFLATILALVPLAVRVGVVGPIALVIGLALLVRRFRQLLRVENALLQEIERLATEFHLEPIVEADGSAPTDPRSQPLDADVATLEEQGIRM
jgi:GT2 family glycosyltransferase